MKNLFTLSLFAFLISCTNDLPEKAIEKDSIPAHDLKKSIVPNTDKVQPEVQTTDQTNSTTLILENKNKTSKSGAPKKSDQALQSPEESAQDTKMIKVDFSGVYNEILKNFVSDAGKVNYSAIKTTREMLRQATQHFEENPPENSWSRNEKLAYWINAYNLYTIELIVDNYPVKSIKDIASGKPWDKKFIQLDGRNLSLNDIENGIIRKDFDEPRIHFAVNCASISCPKLLNKAYTASNLNILLDEQSKRFINDKSMNSISTNSLEISNLFDWYSSDFGNLVSFLNKYAEVEISPKAKITYKDYNWNLNN